MAFKNTTLFAASTVTSLALVAGLASASALAQEQGLRNGDGQGLLERASGRFERRINRKFERLDADGDGVLVLDELLSPALEKAEQRFDRKDADDDGFLTFEEATSGDREPRDLSDIAEDIAQCVADIKAETGNENIIVPDPDNYLSPQEKFDAADTSGDGVIDLTEALTKVEAKVTEGFAETDTNDDGQVTLEEFTAKAQSRKATRRAVRSCINDLLDTSDV